MEITLGSKARDKVSGFAGMVTAQAKHLYGCDRVWLQPPIDKDGKFVDGSWFDVLSVDLVEAPQIEKTGTNGGPPSKVK